MHLSRPQQAWVFGVLALVLALAVAVGVGPGDLPLGRLLGLAQGGDPVAVAILREVRLPRAVGAALVGATLALAGLLLQAATRNPVADPYLVGTSAGATTAAVLAAPVARALAAPLGLSFERLLPWLQPLAAFAGALAAVSLAFAIARAGGPLRPERVLLAGLVLTAFGGAVTSFLLYQFSDLRLRAATLWLMGGVALPDLALAAPMGLLLGLAVHWALRAAPGLNALGLGTDAARGLGVDESRLGKHAVWWASALAAIAVAIGGIIGFVGLLVPHALRGWLGRDHRALVPGAALFGAAFLLLCDALARVLVAPAELPVGILTALAGAPVLVVLLGLHRRPPLAPPPPSRPPGAAPSVCAPSAAAAPPLLACERLSVHYPQQTRPVLTDVQLALHAGELLALVGPNGAGKSSLLRVLAGVAAPSSGQVSDRGAQRPKRTHAPAGVTFLPQDPHAEPGLTVRELVALGRTAFLGPAPWRSELSATDDAAVTRALARLQLTGRAAQACQTLSGGQQQRVFVAMALAREAEVLLLDEPTRALDLPHAHEMMQLLSHEAHAFERLVVVVAHDLRLALRHADRVIVLHDGRALGPFAPGDRALTQVLEQAFSPDIRQLAGLD